MNFKQSGSSDYVIGDEYTFHTKKSAGSAFTFTVQADPHQGDKNFNVDLYLVALQNQLNDNPDFFIDLGDTFMIEKYYPDTEQGAFDAAYDHRQHFDIYSQVSSFIFGKRKPWRWIGVVAWRNFPEHGHFRVTVTGSVATVEYVRAFRPEDKGYTNGEISYTYTVH